MSTPASSGRPPRKRAAPPGAPSPGWPPGPPGDSPPRGRAASPGPGRRICSRAGRCPPGLPGISGSPPFRSQRCCTPQARAAFSPAAPGAPGARNGWGHQIDIVGPLADQIKKDAGQLLGRDLPPRNGPVADLPVLAEHTAQRAAGEKHRPAAPAPLMEHSKVSGPGNAHPLPAAAHARPGAFPGHAAVSGAQAAGLHPCSASMAQLLPRWPLVFRWEKIKSLSHMVHTWPTAMFSSSRRRKGGTAGCTPTGPHGISPAGARRRTAPSGAAS
mgnify:CR=1 FL=1